MTEFVIQDLSLTVESMTGFSLQRSLLVPSESSEKLSGLCLSPRYSSEWNSFIEFNIAGHNFEWSTPASLLSHTIYSKSFGKFRLRIEMPPNDSCY